MDMKQLRPIVFNVLLQKPETNFREVEDKIIRNISDYYSRDDTSIRWEVNAQVIFQRRALHFDHELLSSNN